MTWITTSQGDTRQKAIAVGAKAPTRENHPVFLGCLEAALEATCPLSKKEQDAQGPPSAETHLKRVPHGERGEQTLKQACSRLPGSAICVQNFDDSLNSAIRITYRISLRSSSLREPRYPLLRVVMI